MIILPSAIMQTRKEQKARNNKGAPRTIFNIQILCFLVCVRSSPSISHGLKIRPVDHMRMTQADTLLDYCEGP